MLYLLPLPDLTGAWAQYGSTYALKWQHAPVNNLSGTSANDRAKWPHSTVYTNRNCFLIITFLAAGHADGACSIS